MSKDKESISKQKESKNTLKMEKNNIGFFSKTLRKLNKKNLIISSIILVGIVAITAIVINVINEKYKTEESKICSVQFNTNGGSEIETVNLECGKAIQEPKIPEKNGFEFVGWYLNDKEFNFLSKIEKNIIIEAKWEAKEELEIVIVSFDSNGGTSVNSIEVAKGETISPPLEPTKKGYKFNGWTYENKVFDFRNPIVKKITLKATWKKVEPVNNSSGSSSQGTGNNSSGSSSQGTGNNSSNNNKYKCSGNYNKTILEKTVTIGYNDHISWTFSTGVSYSNDDCYITYKSSNSSIASISEDGKISAHKKGSTYIYECINDKTTKTEIGCFQGNLIVSDENSNDIDNTVENNDDIDVKFSDVQGIWYKVGTNDETITFSHKDEKYYVSTKNIDSYTLESNRADYYSGAECGFDWKYCVTYYNIKKTSNSNLSISRNNITVKLTRIPSVVKINKILITNNKENLIVGDSNVMFEANVYPGNADNLQLNWTSSNQNIVSVTGNPSPSLISPYYKSFTGYLKANGVGSATITVSSKDGGAIAEFTVTVSNIAVNSITLNKTSIELTKGNSETLTAIITPSNATNKNVTWTSSDTSIVAVNSSGKITAIKKGTATITATSIDGGYTEKCVVTVSNPPLTIKGSIGIQTTVSSSGATRGVHAEINASGGTGSYTYYYIKVYKDGTLIGSTTNTTSNELFIVGHTNGSYTMEYEVRDSDGTIKTGTSTSTISGF